MKKKKFGVIFIVVLLLTVGTIGVVSAKNVDNKPLFDPGNPLNSTITLEPYYSNPYIDVDEWRDIPVTHRYVHGGFEGTDTRFSFYFPTEGEYEGRFFQKTHPAQVSEYAPDSDLAFSIDNGAYYVRTNMGGAEADDMPADSLLLSAEGEFDPTIGGYRANVAAATYSRILAADMYGNHRPYGYLYGGSGGSWQTITSSEVTSDVWDGFVPYIYPWPNAAICNLTTRFNVLRVLADKFPEIIDAIEPGGSGDPYAGLNDEERTALKEATQMGFPLRGWWNYEDLAQTVGAFRYFADCVPILDPTYVDDFWSEPGYLGTDPDSSVSDDLFEYETTIAAVVSPAPPLLGVILTSMPPGDVAGTDIYIESNAAEVQRFSVFQVVEQGPYSVVLFGYGADPDVLNSIQPGDKVRIDNSWTLALQTYYRHQIPTPDPYVWETFLDPDGNPIYPQRDILSGPIIYSDGTGAIPTGQFNGKMIMVQGLMDIDAFPWQADYYRELADDAMGMFVNDNFRIWYIDYAQHVPSSEPAAQARTVSHLGVIQQALIDVSAWVEKDIRPPVSTNYEVIDAQVVVPETAAERRGIQPVVTLQVNDGERADVTTNDEVRFTAIIEVPEGAGEVVAVEWDFEGIGDFPVTAEITPGTLVTLEATYTYTEAGTYFPVLRATSQREGDAETPYTRIQNLGRVRVFVE